MRTEYLDVYKVAKCAEHKFLLDKKSAMLKKNVIEQCTESSDNANSFIFNLDEKNRLTLRLPTYDLELTFNERLVVINEVPLMRYIAVESSDEKKNEIISFFLNKNGLVYIGEYKPNPSYGYEDASLFLDILDVTLKALKNIDKISY